MISDIPPAEKVACEGAGTTFYYCDTFLDTSFPPLRTDMDVATKEI